MVVGATGMPVFAKLRKTFRPLCQIVRVSGLFSLARA